MAQSAIVEALQKTQLSTTIALRLPLAPQATISVLEPPIEASVLTRLRGVQPLSGTHWVLVEIVRRQFARHAKAIDKADKEAARSKKS